MGERGNLRQREKGRRGRQDVLEVGPRLWESAIPESCNSRSIDDAPFFHLPIDEDSRSDNT